MAFNHSSCLNLLMLTSNNCICTAFILRCVGSKLSNPPCDSCILPHFCYQATKNYFSKVLCKGFSLPSPIFRCVSLSISVNFTDWQSDWHLALYTLVCLFEVFVLSYVDVYMYSPIWSCRNNREIREYIECWEYWKIWNIRYIGKIGNIQNTGDKNWYC